MKINASNLLDQANHHHLDLNKKVREIKNMESNVGNMMRMTAMTLRTFFLTLIPKG